MERSDVALCSELSIQSLIQTIRGQQVMLDRDLAFLYHVETKALNQAVKRNAERFPARFRFQLSAEEMSELVTNCDRFKNMRHSSVGMFAFTEQGVAMLATVLRSPIAVDISIRVVDAFVAMRHTLASMAPVFARIDATERRLLRQETAQVQNEERFEKIFDAMSNKSFPPQKVFFEGQFYDAFVQMKRFVRMAKKELVVIDPYFDDSCLPLVAQKRPGVAVTVVVCARGHRKLHDIDVAQFNRQHANSLTVNESESFHDRYLVIDRSTLVHVGASLNSLGKKCFAFSTLGAEIIPDILARVIRQDAADLTVFSGTCYTSLDSGM
ncbi:MAG: ORF6N domain-containing protein [Pseudomonadota bacterium]|nr:ORF6N domain-containing protein [Pseudomonadota bacterium]